MSLFCIINRLTVNNITYDMTAQLHNIINTESILYIYKYILKKYIYIKQWQCYHLKNGTSRNSATEATTIATWSCKKQAHMLLPLYGHAEPSLDSLEMATHIPYYTLTLFTVVNTFLAFYMQQLPCKVIISPYLLASVCFFDIFFHYFCYLYLVKTFAVYVKLQPLETLLAVLLLWEITYQSSNYQSTFGADTCC